MTSYTYTRNVPQAAQTIAATQPIINNNFQFMQDWAQSDHAFIANNSASLINGWHNKVTFPNTSAPPSIAGGVGAMYTDTRDAATVLAFVNSGGSFPMFGRNPSIPGGINSTGETSMPGPVYIKWGFFSSALPGTQGNSVVTFPSSFPTACFNVSVTPSKSSATVGPNSILTLVANVVDNTKFSFSYSNQNGSTFTGFYWLAIGN